MVTAPARTQHLTMGVGGWRVVRFPLQTWNGKRSYGASPVTTVRESAAMQDDLKLAFTAIYRDLCAHGLIEDRPGMFEALWLDFQTDMNSGFPSLFRPMEPGQH